MEYVKYMCPECFYEQKKHGICPTCNVTLIASCPVCGNPIVGEHIHLEEVNTMGGSKEKLAEKWSSLHSDESLAYTP